jgi:predicted enzyme related to lactoylglutathione lyase
MTVNVTDFLLNITSERPERLHAFYRDTVGLPERPEMGPHALVLGPGATLLIDGHSETCGRAKEPSRWLVNLLVDDIAAEETRLRAAGVPFIRSQGVEYWGGVISTFVDPDGNYCQVVQYRPELATADATG